MYQPWFVVQTKPRQERRAEEHLRRQGFEVCLPLMEVEKIQSQQVVLAVEPLFTRYLFLRETEQGGAFRAIRSTLGVSRLVSFGDRPATLSDDVVRSFREGPRALQERILKRGQRVQLVRGPLAGLEAVFLEPDGEARALILIELIGRPHHLPTDVGNLLPLNP